MTQQQETPNAAPRPRASAQTAAICLLLVALNLAIYAQTITFDFVLYDDPDYVTQNPVVQRGVTAASMVWALTAMHASNWHPLTWVSHMLDFQLFGFNAGGHHLTSVLLHILNTLALFVLFRRLTAEPWPSAFVAALFAVHPLHVESVAWVAERKDVLSTLFFLLATLAYVGYVRKGGAGRYAGVAVLFALGLMAKPMVVTLPLVLLLLDYWPLRRQKSWAKLVVEKLPLFALSAASSVLTMISQRAGGSMEATDLVPLHFRIVNATISYARYVGKIFWPTDLAVLYPHPNLAGGTLWDAWQLAAAGSLLVVITVLVVALAGRRRYPVVGWFFFVITLLPVIGLVQVGQQAIADRYTYVPSIGLFVVVAWGALDGLRLPRWNPAVKRAVIAIAASAVVVAGVAASSVQVRHWRNSLALFERALAVTAPTPIMLSNLGVVLAEQRRFDEAIDCQRRALEIKPDYARAHNNLGITFQLTGRLDEAIQHYRWAVEINPDSAAAHNNLAAALRTAGRSSEAVEHYRRALEIDPGLDRARQSLEELLVGGP